MAAVVCPTTALETASSEIAVAIYILAKHVKLVGVLVSLANIAILESANTSAPMEPASLQTDVHITTKTYPLKNLEE